ncbi:MAG: hypothetical protein JSW73_03235 [Candidatus Woesearchaeota archaeon]|nr:MAG: hypothetical protein JSW73_03235 [Candidatus Woesearchaeota archaeon]
MVKIEYISLKNLQVGRVKIEVKTKGARTSWQPLTHEENAFTVKGLSDRVYQVTPAPAPYSPKLRAVDVASDVVKKEYGDDTIYISQQIRFNPDRIEESLNKPVDVLTGTLTLEGLIIKKK